MTFETYRYLVFSDLYRITGRATFSLLIRQLMFGEGFKYVFWMRTCRYARSGMFRRWLVYPWAKLVLMRLRYRLGISIPIETSIGSGFYIGHFDGIVVNGECEIGKNCNISHGVTLGQANRGRSKGCPVIGDNVYIGPGAKVIGAVRVGRNVAIGANSVVTSNVLDNSVVVGIPAKVISQDGSSGYIDRTDYE